MGVGAAGWGGSPGQATVPSRHTGSKPRERERERERGEGGARRGREERGAAQGRLGKTWAARGRRPWHAGSGGGCAGGARAGPNGRGGPGRGEATAQGEPRERARWDVGWGPGLFLFLSYFFIFCSFLFSPPFQIELLIKRTLHKITHSRK
jgi:hypothetical protein